MAARPAPPRIGVAYSGGSDSTALLHTACAAASSLGADVVALHVHHGLSAHADAWLAHAQTTCTRWRRAGRPLSLLHRRLVTQPARGESVEAWARDARYAALVALAKEAGLSLVLLAHHQRDQAETFLLQALRKAGPAGLAAMPREFEMDGVRFVRPWLDKPKADIDAYLHRHRLKVVIDDSNADPRFARSRLRREVWPALQGAFPGADDALARCAQWQAEAQALVDAVGAEDAGRCTRDNGLSQAAWLDLPQQRRLGALQAWWRASAQQPLAASLGQRLLHELPRARSGTQWPVAAQALTAPGSLRLHAGLLRWVPDEALLLRQAPVATVPRQALHIDGTGDFRCAGWAGHWRVRALVPGRDVDSGSDCGAIGAAGVALADLRDTEVRMREGGEQFQSGPGRPPRSLKKQFQAAGLPDWVRQGPLLWSNGRLLHVPGLGLDARFWASGVEPACTIEWVPDRPQDPAPGVAQSPKARRANP